MMDIEQLIDALEDKIDSCTTIPIWGRGIIDKDELLDMIQDIRMKYPDEMKQAKWVKEERQRIINDAQKEAAGIIKAAEDKIAAMVNEHDITQQAYEKANQIVDSAQKNSHEIRVGANQYADDVLRALEEELIKTAETIRANRNGSR
ncbi:MAG: ATPase [Eubacteriales bacterium]|jgi:H+-ATPase subunit H|nr:ATPase [Congzhengia minquanensis]